MFDSWGDAVATLIGVAVLVFWILPGIYLAGRGFFARGGHGGDEGHSG